MYIDSLFYIHVSVQVTCEKRSRRYIVLLYSKQNLVADLQYFFVLLIRGHVLVLDKL